MYTCGVYGVARTSQAGRLEELQKVQKTEVCREHNYSWSVG